ncbi:MAG TPA: GGDEF domain-containing protein [Phycisphaeraceae bacterium]
MNEALLDRVLRSPRLPSLPTVALEVIDLVQRQDVNLKQIAHIVQHDVALSSKILKTVNSSFYGQTHAVSTVSHALVVLGLSSVKTLALGFILVGNIKNAGGEGFDPMAFWKRSLYTATAARQLAQRISLPQQEEAFLGGLLQDLGMLALSQALGQEYDQLISQTEGVHARLRSIETEALGIDHTLVGAKLAEKWGLPPQLIAPVRHHESPEEVTEVSLIDLVRCVALGNRVADVFMDQNPGQALEAFCRLAQQWVGIEPEEAQALLRTIHSGTNEMRRLFDLPTGELGNPDELLARANEALLQISLQNQKQASELEQQNRQLALQACTDSLTGAANRRKFNEFVSAQFHKAVEGDGPLSVLFLDTDHFKRFNDTYGHPTGDRVLVTLAKLLMQLTPEGGLAARYGGEEFAIVLPRTDRRAAALLAEHIRTQIQAATVLPDDGQPLHVTASIGVATYEAGVFRRVEQLIKAADQGVYAAKAAGRNCVRIFMPRTHIKPTAA